MKDREVPDIIASDECPLIPPGRYDATIVAAELRSPFKTKKLRLAFSIELTTPGAERPQSIVLYRHYNISVVRGRLKAGPSSQYWRDYARVTNRRPSRRDRLAPSALVGVMVVIEVRTVTHGASVNGGPRRPLSEHAQYSVVDAILEVICGGGPRA